MRPNAFRCIAILACLITAATIVSCGRRDSEEEQESKTEIKPAMLPPAEQPAIVTSGNLQLRAVVTLPVREIGALVPGAVIVHSFGDLDRDGTSTQNNLTIAPYRDLTRRLAEQGIASVRFDKRTLAPYAATLNIRELTLEDYYADAIAALKLLRTVECVDPERLYFIGHGEGAVVVPALVEANPSLGVRGLVLIAPPLIRADDLIIRQLEYQIHQLDLFIKHDQRASEKDIQRRERMQQEIEAYKDAFGRLQENGEGWGETRLHGYFEKYWRSAIELYGGNAERIKRSALPVLIVQGNLDPFVIAEDLLQRREELERTGHITVVLLDSLGHNLIEPGGQFVRPEATIPIANWLRTPPAPLPPPEE